MLDFLPNLSYSEGNLNYQKRSTYNKPRLFSRTVSQIEIKHKLSQLKKAHEYLRQSELYGCLVDWILLDRNGIDSYIIQGEIIVLSLP